MYMCMYVCMYVYIYVHYVCMFIMNPYSLCMYVCMYVCMYPCMSDWDQYDRLSSYSWMKLQTKDKNDPTKVCMYMYVCM